MDIAAVLLVVLLGTVVFSVLNSLHWRHDHSDVSLKARHIYFPRRYVQVTLERWINLQQWDGTSDDVLELLIGKMYPGCALRTEYGNRYAYIPESKRIVFDWRYPYRVGKWRKC